MQSTEALQKQLWETQGDGEAEALCWVWKVKGDLICYDLVSFRRRKENAIGGNGEPWKSFRPRSGLMMSVF